MYDILCVCVSLCESACVCVCVFVCVCNCVCVYYVYITSDCYVIVTGMATKARLELIRAVACCVICDLKCKAEAAYSEMNDWLGGEFLQEMQWLSLYLSRYAN